MIRKGSLVMVIRHHCDGDAHDLYKVDTVHEIQVPPLDEPFVGKCHYCHGTIFVQEPIAKLTTFLGRADTPEEFRGWFPFSWLREIKGGPVLAITTAALTQHPNCRCVVEPVSQLTWE